MKMLYLYDKSTKAFLDDFPVLRVEDVMITHVEEMQLIDNEEVIITIELDSPRLIEGLTDKKPPSEMHVIPKISPKFIDGDWINDQVAIDEYLAANPQPEIELTPEQQRIADLEAIVADLMLGGV